MEIGDLGIGGKYMMPQTLHGEAMVPATIPISP